MKNNRGIVQFAGFVGGRLYDVNPEITKCLDVCELRFK